jgi:hypothetical protein
MKNIIEQAIETQFDDHTRIVRQLQALREHYKCATAAVERFGGKVSIWHFFKNDPPRLDLDVRLRDFREAAPIIEFIEDWRPPGFKLECTGSHDLPDFGARDFSFGRQFKLCCKLRDDGSATCKAIVVGYKEPEPIYEFDCGDAP